MQWMFYNCNSLVNVNLTGINTERVTSMAHLFRNCTSLGTVDVTMFETPQLTNMAYMFAGCTSLENMDLSKFNTTIVSTMEGHLRRRVELIKFDMHHWNLQTVNSFAYFFRNCRALESVNLTDVNPTKLTTMEAMFQNCVKIKDIDMTSFHDIKKLRSLNYMCDGCTSLRSIQFTDGILNTGKGNGTATNPDYENGSCLRFMQYVVPQLRKPCGSQSEFVGLHGRSWIQWVGMRLHVPGMHEPKDGGHQRLVHPWVGKQP